MTKCLCVVCYFNVLVYIAVFESDGYCEMLKMSCLFIKPVMPRKHLEWRHYTSRLGADTRELHWFS